MMRIVSLDQPCLAQISVRDFVEFAMRIGDLQRGTFFTAPTRGIQGLRAHQSLQKSRPQNYQPEVPITYAVTVADVSLQLDGRIDGVWQANTSTILEEIKTVLHNWDGQADPIHWAQAKTYAWMYCETHLLESIDVQLSYIDLQTNHLCLFREAQSLHDLRQFVQPALDLWIAWARQEYAWKLKRNASMTELTFPFPSFRPGQHALARSIYRTLTSGKTLFVEAPTGIGKTMSVLFPATKALASGSLQRLVYLTAKNSGQAAAEQALSQLARNGLRIRALTMTSRERLCPADNACQLGTCPRSVGYYDRVHNALRDLLDAELIEKSKLTAIAHTHSVCPYQLALDALPWVDLLVADYNYAFDPQARLRQFGTDWNHDTALLVDEAHNLVDRSRAMFSAELSISELQQAADRLRRLSSPTARILSRVIRYLQKPDSPAAPEPNQPMLPPGDILLSVPPKKFIDLIRKLTAQLEPLLVENSLATEDQQLATSAYFSSMRFLRTAECANAAYKTLIRPGCSIQLLCLDAAQFLEKTTQTAAATVFFSGTLSPMAFFQKSLGSTKEDPVVVVPSPFPPDNLNVTIAHEISTKYQHRIHTHDQVATMLSHFTRSRPGNYIAFFPSYAYLEAIQGRLQLAQGQSLITQKAQMNDEERRQFVESFQENRNVIGLALMGGIFGEAIDLGGENLSGVAILGVGLPQLCVERELIRQYFTEAGLNGFEYAYMFPGLNRVLQAAGRLIRSETDRGSLLLIDSRFAEYRYRQLLPAAWKVQWAGNDLQVRNCIDLFWNGQINQQPPKVNA